MKKQLAVASTTVIGIAIWGSYIGTIAHQTQAEETQEVEIKFNATVGEKPFKCGESYNLGKPATNAIPTDFRFYLSEIALIDDSGKAVAVNLKQDGKWQYQNVVLLDFENKSGACGNGTVETRDRAIGSVPKGNYKGLQFTLGIPFNLNHADAALAPSPLNLTSLWWNWQGGYKFLRIDLKTQSGHQASTSHKHQGHDSQQGFSIHLGSTGCTTTGDDLKPDRCSNSNTAKVIFNNFDSQKNTVIADLNALVDNTNLEVNQPDTPLGCMSAPNDSDCAGIMAALGLPFNGQSAAEQRFFKLQ